MIDDHDVHAAKLLKVALSDIIQEADLIAALGGSLLLGNSEEA